jgi:CubicO group peptidase (beta-lactamase class C family)
MNRRLMSGAVLSAAIFVAAFAIAESPSAVTPDSDDVRIARVENGLLPPVLIKGQALVARNLKDEMAKHKVPGVSVSYFAQGKIVWARGYGFANSEAKRPVTPDTLFQAASISKPIASLAALHLVEEGKLSLDEDVNVKLKSWKVPENEFTKAEKVTLRRILTHSAGLTVHGFPGYASDEAVPAVVQVLNGEKPANTAPVRVDIEPGKIFRYSGGGFTIMQLLMTDVTSKPFPQIMHELVLQPAGMIHSTYEQPLPKALSANETMAYRADGQPVKGGPHTYPEMAAAGLWTTPTDLGHAAIEMEKEYDGQSSKILSQKMIRKMLSKQKDDWGLGVAVEGEGATLHFSHSGGNEGYRCFFVDYPVRHEGMAVMTNSDSGPQVYDEVLRAIAKEYGWPDYQPVEHAVANVDPKALESYVGTYESKEAPKATVTLHDGKLYFQAEPLGPDPQLILPDSSADFFFVEHQFTLHFDANPGAAATSVTVHVGNQNLVLKRIP